MGHRKKMPEEASWPGASRPYMPGYSMMFDEKRGPLTWRWAVKTLSAARNYWVATVTPNQRPHVMPVWGVWLNNRFYFSTGPHSRKAKNLAKNSSCVVCPENADRAVIVEGTARKIPWHLLPDGFTAAYRKKYRWRLDPEQGPVYHVRPSKVFGFGSGNPTRWTFLE